MKNIKVIKGEQIDTWRQSKFGRLLTNIESQNLVSFWQTARGDYLLMLGDPLAERLIYGSQIKNRIFLSPQAYPAKRDDHCIQADYEALPISPYSVQTIVLPHVLEFSKDPYQVLRESEMTLAPQGYVVLVGFNPLSLLGLRRLFTSRKQAPWSGKFRFAWRIKDWLQLLNFNIVEEKHVFYLPRVQGHRLRSVYAVLDLIGKMLFPIFGGVYILIAQKKQFGMYADRVQWSAAADVMPDGLVKPMTRGMQHEQDC
ncbi:MAG: methyltransferase domain-containing protein [Pseudomonadota bacterium]